MSCHVCVKTGIRACGEDAEDRCEICGVCSAEAERENRLPKAADIKLKEALHDGYDS